MPSFTLSYPTQNNAYVIRTRNVQCTYTNERKVLVGKIAELIQKSFITMEMLHCKKWELKIKGKRKLDIKKNFAFAYNF